MDLPDGAVDVVLPLQLGVGAKRVDQDQRPFVADAHALAIAAVRQDGVVALQVMPGDFYGVVVQGRQQYLAVFPSAQPLDQLAQRDASPAVLSRQAQRCGERGGDFPGGQLLQALEVAGLGGSALGGVQLQHATAFGGFAHRARVRPLRAAEGHQENQGGACMWQGGWGSEHHHNFHVFRFRRCKVPGLVRVFHRSLGGRAGADTGRLCRGKHEFRQGQKGK